MRGSTVKRKRSNDSCWKMFPVAMLYGCDISEMNALSGMGRKGQLVDEVSSVF